MRVVAFAITAASTNPTAPSLIVSVWASAVIISISPDQMIAISA